MHFLSKMVIFHSYLGLPEGSTILTYPQNNGYNRLIIDHVWHNEIMGVLPGFFAPLWGFRPGRVSAVRRVPGHIPRPDYVEQGKMVSPGTPNGGLVREFPLFQGNLGW